MLGYRQAIRDRIPDNWVFVLKYLHKLDAYVALVYSTRIGPINHHWNRQEQRELKKKALHELFPNKDNPNRRFFDTLDESRMEATKYRRWLKVDEWMDWFNKNYLFIESFLNNASKPLNSAENIKKLASTYCKDDEKLATAVIEYYVKQQNNERI